MNFSFDLVVITVILEEMFFIQLSLNVTPGLSRFGLQFDNEVEAKRMDLCEGKMQVRPWGHPRRAWLLREGSARQCPLLSASLVLFHL